MHIGGWELGTLISNPFIAMAAATAGAAS